MTCSSCPAATSLAFEVIDLKRFPTAPKLMSYVGLTPSEHSSGERRLPTHPETTRVGTLAPARTSGVATWLERSIAPQSLRLPDLRRVGARGRSLHRPEVFPRSSRSARSSPPTNSIAKKQVSPSLATAFPGVGSECAKLCAARFGSLNDPWLASGRSLLRPTLWRLVFHARFDLFKRMASD